MGGVDVSIRHHWDSRFSLDVSFVSDHRVTALFGPSGAGKSTVLNCIAGLIRPKEGRIRIGARDVFDSNRSICLPPRERRVGYVFQDHLLFPHLDAESNLRFGFARKTGPIGFDAVVELLELRDLLNSMPMELSGGQKQRIAIGRALLSQPDLLIMDEPLASLDEKLRVKIINYLERLVAEFAMPILFVSHSQAEVRRLANWIVMLEAGRVQSAGTPDQVLSEPASLALSNGMGPVNILCLDEIKEVDGSLLGTIANHEVTLPRPTSDSKPSRYIAFDPTDVMLALEDVAGVSARNHLKGTIVGIVPLAGRTLVAVDVGAMLWAELSPTTVDQMDLKVGGTIYCLIKTQSLRFI